MQDREQRRLEVLRSYEVLDTAPERDFDDLVSAAAAVAGVPIALITLVDEDRQWFKAAQGMAATETPLSVSVCRHVVLEDDEIVVADAQLDPRFAAIVPVAEGAVRFYAGFPLRTSGGEVLGTLCVSDDRPHELDEARRHVLRVLAVQVVAQLELRRHLRRTARDGVVLPAQRAAEPAGVVPSSDELARLAAVHRYDVLDTPADGAFDRVAALAARLLDVPIAVISVVDHDRIWFKSAHGLDATEVGRDPGLCASAVLSDAPWIVTDARRDPRALTNPLVAGAFGLQFYAGAPLTTPDGYNLGMLCVIDREPRTITAQETQLLVSLAEVVVGELELRRATQAAVDGAAQRADDLEHVARVLRSRLVPSVLPAVPFLDVAARCRPVSSSEVGGDFYDLFPLDGGDWGVVIGDVMGKGPQAACRTSAARHSTRGAALHDPSPASVLRTVNQALLADPDEGPETPFVTALLARVAPCGDDVHVRFTSAGHPLPTLLRADGTVGTVGEPGTLLGILPELDLVESEVVLHPGDALVLVTDGVHDSGAPEPLEQDGLERVLAARRGRSAAELVDEVQRLVALGHRDDAAVLVLAVPPRQG